MAVDALRAAVAETPTSRAHHVPSFRLPSTDGLAEATARVNDFVATTPEPDAAVAASLALAALAVLRRRRSPPRSMRSASGG